eukprot:gene10584-biopygen16796
MTGKLALAQADRPGRAGRADRPGHTAIHPNPDTLRTPHIPHTAHTAHIPPAPFNLCTLCTVLVTRIMYTVRGTWDGRCVWDGWCVPPIPHIPVHPTQMWDGLVCEGSAVRTLRVICVDT